MPPILEALTLALQAEPYVVGLVNDLIDLWHKFKTGQHVTPADVDAVVNKLDRDVDAFDNLKPPAGHDPADTHQPRINPLP